MSPDHALYLHGVLVPARLLVNGASIIREPRDDVTYYHVELRRHGLLDAEGVAAESYLDTGNRGFFANAGEPLALHPDLLWAQERRAAGSCAPFADSAELLAPIWRALAAARRNAVLLPPPGPETTDEPALGLLADGQRLRPISRANGRYTFVLPRVGRSVRLVSRGAEPSDTVPWGDPRRLGVMVTEFTLRAGATALTIPLDHPSLRTAGGNRSGKENAAVPLDERECGGASARWPVTDPWLLEAKIAATLRYPLPRDETAVAEMSDAGPLVPRPEPGAPVRRSSSGG